MREQAAVALLGRRRQRFLSAPGLNNDCLGQVGMQYLVPPEHQFVVLGQNLLQPLVIVGLQILVILHAVRVNKRLDLRIGVPIFAVDLVSSS